MIALYEDYRRLVYKTICDIVADRWETEDLQQDVFLKIIKNKKISTLRGLDQKHRVMYIAAAARNTAYTHQRRKNLFTFLPLDENRDSPALEDRTFERFIEREEDLDCLARIWPKLKLRTQLLLESRHILDKSYQEIAEEMGVKLSGARAALTRARAEAKALMIAEMEGTPPKKD